MTDKLFLDEGWRVANDEEVWDASGLHQIATCGVPGRAPNPEQAAKFAELIAQLPALVKALDGLAARFEATGEGWMSDPAWQAAAEVITRVREVFV